MGRLGSFVAWFAEIEAAWSSLASAAALHTGDITIADLNITEADLANAFIGLTRESPP